MTDIAVQVPALALDPATRNTLIQAVADCLPCMPSANERQRTNLREAAFALVGELCPTTPVEAMLAADVVAAHFASVHAYRCATRPDLTHDLQLRYQASARSLARLESAKRRELARHQAAQPALPAGFAAAHAALAQAGAPSAPARPVAPAPRADAAAGQRPGNAAPVAAARGGAANPVQAVIDQVLAKAAAESADDDLAPPADAALARLMANAHAAPAETAPPAEDLGARLQAEVEARKAAAEKLAA